jgi:hypothetical protein
VNGAPPRRPLRAALALAAARLWFSGYRRFVRRERDGKASLSLYDPTQRIDVALVSLLGLSPDEAKAGVERLSHDLGYHHRVVFVVDDPSLLTLQGGRFSFECVPSLADRSLSGGDLPWRDYMQEYADLLVAKWRPVTIVDVGTPVRSYYGETGPFR